MCVRVVCVELCGCVRVVCVLELCGCVRVVCVELCVLGLCVC